MLGYFKEGVYISTDMALYCLLRERGYEIPKSKMWYDDKERSLFYAVLVPSIEVDRFKDIVSDFKDKTAVANISKIYEYQTEFRKILDFFKM